ncbi:MAG: DUF6452 family protein [Bacteroidota bacterium]
MKKIFILLLISLLFHNCERDDICAEGTPTTPRLLLEFRNILDEDALKSVTGLTVFGEGLNENERSIVSNSNTNSLALPLKIGIEGEETTTRFIMRKDSGLDDDDDPDTNSNEDILEITYVSEFVYVSRACGYKSIFNNLRVTIVPDGDNWALLTNFPDSNTDNINVENETATHLYILH